MGVRTSPFAAHAWVEADGQPVGETYPPDHYRKLISISPAGAKPGA
ncbi:lasso peptide biosynthesis B2 protein [Streptomyces globisporus]